MEKQEFRFGPFRLNAAERCLWRGDERVALGPKVFDTLLILVERAGEVVSKDQLFARVWPGTFVDESSLSQNIRLLRRAVGDEYVETVPKVGYRFAQPVTVQSPLPRPPARSWWRWIWIAAASCLLLAAGIVIVGRHRSAAAAAPIRSLAVLPFVSFGEQRNTSALADGLTEEVINALTRDSGLRIVARTSSFQYKNQARDIRDIGKALNVDAILEGSVRREQEKIRVTAQLIRASDGYHLWSAGFDRQLKDALSLQEEIAGAITSSLLVQSKSDTSQRPVRLLPRNAEARDAYLDGRYQWNFETGEGMASAVESLKKSIALEPDYAPAHAFLADCYLMLAVYGQAKPADMLPLARKEASRALEISPSNTLGLSALALAEVLSGGDRSKAEQNFLMAIRSSPQSLRPRFLYSFYVLGPAGRVEEADQHISVARDLDPFAATVGAAVIAVPCFARKYDKALEIGAQIAGKSSNCFLCLMMYGWSLGGAGRFQDALDTVQQAEKMVPDFPAAIRYEGYCLAKLGRATEARATLRRLIAASQHRYVGAENMAYIFAGLSDRTNTITWLRKGVDERAFGMTLLDTFPGYDFLRGDPDYEHIRAAMGL